MSDYPGLQADALDMLTEFGQPVTLQAPTSGTYDPATTTLSGTAPAPVITNGAIFPLSRGLMHMPGTDIQAGDRQLLLPGSIAQPPLNTSVTIGGVAYVITEVKPLNPGGTALVYDCLIRGAP